MRLAFLPYVPAAAAGGVGGGVPATIRQPGRWVTSDRLLVETHLPEETLLSTALFSLGFLAILAFVAAGPASGR